jgi:hypothetical protein
MKSTATVVYDGPEGPGASEPVKAALRQTGLLSHTTRELPTLTMAAEVQTGGSPVVVVYEWTDSGIQHVVSARRWTHRAADGPEVYHSGRFLFPLFSEILRLAGEAHRLAQENVALRERAAP